MITRLFSKLDAIYPLPKEVLSAIESQVEIKKFPAKTILLQEGKICDRVYFIVEGLARAYYYKEGQQVTSWFMQDNDFIISVYSFYAQKPSYETIELLEDSVVIGLRYIDLQKMYIQFAEFNIIGRVLSEYYYVRSEERLLALRMQTSQERYEALLIAQPEIFTRFPLKQIASYLGMTPETLSRLRAKK